MGVRLSGLLVVLDGFADLVVGFDFRTVHERERNTAGTIVTLSSTDFAGWRPISILLQVGTKPRRGVNDRRTRCQPNRGSPLDLNRRIACGGQGDMAVIGATATPSRRSYP